MPFVNARETGYGINRMIEPIFDSPITHSIAPAIIVQRKSPFNPYACSTL